MIKRTLLVTLVLTATIVLLTLFGCTHSRIEITEDFQFDEIETVFDQTFEKFELDIDNLYIADINMPSSIIWIDRKDQHVMDVMLEGIQLNYYTDDKGRIIDIEYQEDTSDFYKSDRGEYSLSDDWKQIKQRVSLRDYLDFLSVLKESTILGDHAKMDTDYYEIGTDGLYRQIFKDDFVFNYPCYECKEGEIIQLDNKDLVVNDQIYLPVYLSLGDIIEDKENKWYVNDIFAVVLLGDSNNG